MSEKDLFPDKDEIPLMDSFKWWEKKRLLYNIIIGASGIAGMLIFIGFIALRPIDIIGMLLWGITANAFYFTGFLIEPLAKYYLNSTMDFTDKRSNFFWAGTAMSVLLTIYGTRFSGNPLIMH
jgi:hypothetical protein